CRYEALTVFRSDDFTVRSIEVASTSRSLSSGCLGTNATISASGFAPAGLASWRATFAPHTGNSKPRCPLRLAVVPYGFPYGHRLGCLASSLCWVIGILRWMAHSTASAVQNGPVLNSSCPYWNGPPEKFNCGVEKHLQTRYDPSQGQERCEVIRPCGSRHA